MSNRRFYITTAIPYVNGDPHLGFALECVQADVLARHRRLRGEEVRFLSGTDDNSLKNVEAAAVAGVPVARFVDAKAERFAALREPLELSNDDYIRTSRDPRHRPGVERLWLACAATGDLYERHYEGFYCSGCEAFLSAAELVDGLCPEHRRRPQHVAERNWFFRLSRYEAELLELIGSGRLGIEPAQRRNEVLGSLRGGLEDFSVSRSHERARGWGIPVPDDPCQVIYVWFDALGNYISALEYGSDGELYGRWWERSQERVHVIGKGIIRFHAVYWPAILLSAGEPLPTEVPRTGDTDFREERLAARANELANGLGNLVNRTITLLARHRPRGAPEVEPQADESRVLRTALQRTPGEIDDALSRFDIRSAAAALWSLVEDANRYVAVTRPWELAKAESAGQAINQRDLDEMLSVLADACGTLAREFQPFLPAASARIERALTESDPELGRRLFPKAA